MDLQKMGKFISEMRKKHSLTQSQLGEMLGISGKAVSKWERGIGAPDISLLNELSKILEVNVSEILAGKKIEETLNTEVANNIALSGLGTYNKIFKKKYTKIIIILLLILLALLLSFPITYLVTNYNKCLVYKLSSGSDKFSLEGLMVSNQKENSLIVTGITYDDQNKKTDKEIKVNYMNVQLNIDNEIIMSCDYDFSNIKMEEALKNIFLTVNENSKITDYIYNKSKQKKLEITVYYKNSDVDETLIIPIKIDKKFSNNQLFY